MFVNALFLSSALLTILSAIAMVVTRNIMHSCIFLLGTLLGTAGLYLVLGADFIAAAQVMVYVGGVVILMLFAVMLTGGKEFMKLAQTGLNHIPFMGSKVSYGMGLLTAFIFVLGFLKLFKGSAALSTDGELTAFSTTVEKLGILLITDHVLAFELSSVLLLGALIGAAIIARPKRDL